MKKVVFSITNVRSKSDKKLSGFGYLAEGNLLCPCISKNSKPYIRIFEDVEKRCRPISRRYLRNYKGVKTMIKLNLTATNRQQEKVLRYLQENASETLADKINNGTPFEKDGHPLLNKKTLSGFMRYAGKESRKFAEQGEQETCVDDDTVYGWAIHYFEENY